MGRGKQKTIPFTQKDVNNRELVIKLLSYEETLAKSETGQSLYKNPLNNPITSLTVEKILNRMTLLEFGFDTSDESVEQYRTIFKNYYKSPTDYDKEVLDSVYYMRENKCVYYTTAPIEVNDVCPNVELVELDGIQKSNLYDIINRSGFDYTVIAAFSLS